MAYSKWEIDVEGMGRIFSKFLGPTVHPVSTGTSNRRTPGHYEITW